MLMFLSKQAPTLSSALNNAHFYHAWILSLTKTCYFFSSGLTDKDNMNSDSTNKAHNKVRTLFSSAEAWSCLEWLGFAEEVRKQKLKNNLATVSFVIDCANTPPSASQNMKETNSQSNQREQKAVCGAVRGQRAAFFITEMAENNRWCFLVIFTLRVITFAFVTPRSLNQFTLHSVEGGEKTEPRPLMFVNKPECQTEFWRCVCVCVWPEHREVMTHSCDPLCLC